jgi:hypothetical protein
MNRSLLNLRKVLGFYGLLGRSPSDVSVSGRAKRRLSAVARLLAWVTLRSYQKAFFLEQWCLMFDLGKDMSTSFGSFRKLIPPRDKFWADPQVVEAGDRYHIFIEEYLYSHRKGHISVVEMDRKGNCKGPVRVLERPYHLSYPFVFTWKGQYYMVPESAENRTIELYECIEFPYRWEFKMNLMENVSAVDTTLFGYQGKWWLFTGMPDNAAALPLARLFLYFSDEPLTTEWHPHPLNPIGPDVMTGRPAGRVFAKDGRILRPAQNGSTGYGYGFDLNEILLLSESEYRETKVMSVRPDWSRTVRATHTYSSEGQLTVIDAFMRKPRLLA